MILINSNINLQDRLIYFDPDIMASLPGPFEVFDPAVEAGKVIIIS